MPIKDRADRRTYHREYMRQRRAGQKPSRAKHKQPTESVIEFAISLHKARLDAAFERTVEARVKIEVARRMATAEAKLKQRADHLEALIKGKRAYGYLTTAEIGNIKMALHPDTFRSRTKEQRNAACGDFQTLMKEPQRILPGPHGRRRW
jgi:hypothetical protein